MTIEELKVKDEDFAGRNIQSIAEDVVIGQADTLKRLFDAPAQEVLAEKFADELFVSTCFFLEYYDYARQEFENCYKLLQYLADMSDHNGNAELAKSIRDRFNQMVEAYE